jgi:hypothetical protein
MPTKLWTSVAEGISRYEPSGTPFSYFRSNGKRPKRKSLKTSDLATAKRLLARRRLEAEEPKLAIIGLKDLLEAAVHSGRHGFPENYEGVSGGGLWNIPLKMCRVGKTNGHYAGPQSIRSKTQGHRAPVEGGAVRAEHCEDHGQGCLDRAAC